MTVASDPSALFEAVISRALDVLRGRVPMHTNIPIVVSLLRHRLRATEPAERDLWRHVQDQPVKALELILREVERDLSIRIDRPPQLDTTAAEDLLHHVEYAAQFATPNGARIPRIDQLKAVAPFIEDITTPDSIAELMVEILDPRAAESLFDPAAGVAGLLSTSLDYIERTAKRSPRIYGRESIDSANTLARLNLAFQGRPFEGMTGGDSFDGRRPSEPAEFDCIISNPPYYRHYPEQLHRLQRYPAFAFGPPQPVSDFNYIQLAISRLKPGGTAALLVRFTPLFAGGEQLEIRRRLVLAGCVTCVVTLAPKLLATTSAPCAVLVLRRPQESGGPPKIRLVAADSEFGVGDNGRRILAPANIQRIVAAVRSDTPIDGLSVIRTPDELAARDLSLVASGYLESEGQQVHLGSNTVMRRIGDIAQVRRGPPLGGLKSGETPILRGRDLPKWKIYPDQLVRKDVPPDLPGRLFTRQGDILLQRIGESPSPHYVDPSLVGLDLSDSVFLIRLHEPDDTTARYIVHFLSSDAGQAAIRAEARAGVTPTNSMESLRLVQIPIPEREVMQMALDVGELETILHGHVELARDLKSRLFSVRRPELFASTIRDLHSRYWIQRESLQHPDNLSGINTSIGVAALEKAVALWEQSKDSNDEEFWHRVLEQHPFLLAQLFHYPIVIVRKKAYVGGKQVDNSGGTVVDFLAKSRNTGAALIIELKTPNTRLLAREYRHEVYPWSSELGGAISQVLYYQNTLTREVDRLRRGVDDHLESDAIRCLVIAGNVGEELNGPAKKRSFERLRENLHGVSVIGFDELFGRARELLELLTRPQEPTTAS